MTPIHSLIRTSDDEPNAYGEPSLREQVLAELRWEIVAGRVDPDTIYSAPLLAQRMGVSTTPVREALLELTRAGLLAPMRNRGFKVVEPTLNDLNDLFDVRETLEVEAAVRLARAGVKDASALRSLADEIGGAVESGDVDAYLERDREFHRAFVGLLGNKLMTELVMNLRDNMRLYGITSDLGRERQRASVREHHQLLALVETGDADAIGPLMRHHISTWRKVFSASLTERRSTDRSDRR